MNERRKLLLPALLGVIATAFVGDKAYQTFDAGPLQEKQNKRDRLANDLHETKIRIRTAQQKLPQLEIRQQRSLPYDIEMAISTYRGWLFKTVEDVGLKRPSIDAGQPIRVGKLFDRLSFSLRASGSLEQVTRFMHAFYSAGHLHKIRSVTFNPTSSDRMDLSLSVEALALTSAVSKDTLTDVQSEQLSSFDLQDYRIISQRNFFSATGATWLTTTHLAAITEGLNGHSAWLNTADQKGTVIVDKGQTGKIGEHSIGLIAANSERATLSIDGAEVVVQIGESLAEAMD